MIGSPACTKPHPATQQASATVNDLPCPFNQFILKHFNLSAALAPCQWRRESILPTQLLLQR